MHHELKQRNTSVSRGYPQWTHLVENGDRGRLERDDMRTSPERVSVEVDKHLRQRFHTCHAQTPRDRKESRQISHGMLGANWTKWRTSW